MNFEDIRRDLKNFGLSGVIYDLTYRLLNRMTCYKVLQGMTVSMDSLAPEYLHGDEKYRYLFLSENLLRKFAKDPTNNLTDQFLGRALAKGDHCYAILDGDQLASYGWYSNKPTHISDDLVLHFNHSHIYMYHGYTNHAHRGRRLHAIGMAKALKEFTDKGFAGIVSYVERNNFSSLKSVYRMGYTDLGKIHVIKVFGQYIIHADKNCKALEFNVEAVKDDGAARVQAAFAR